MGYIRGAYTVSGIFGVKKLANCKIISIGEKINLANLESVNSIFVQHISIGANFLNSPGFPELQHNTAFN